MLYTEILLLYYVSPVFWTDICLKINEQAFFKIQGLLLDTE